MLNSGRLPAPKRNHQSRCASANHGMPLSRPRLAQQPARFTLIATVGDAPDPVSFCLNATSSKCYRNPQSEDRQRLLT